MEQLFILIAEDDAVDRHLALAALQKTNHFKKIVLVNNVQEALTYLCKADKLPDIILSDLIMPRRNGFDFFKKIKEIDRLSSIPFVIYTNGISSGDSIKAFELGIKVLEKPFVEMNDYSGLCKTLCDLAYIDQDI
jgi:CheY-like chemotaxis protein